jgi:Subtilase family
VISAGNLDRGDVDHENWPHYLLQPDGNLLDPAQTSAALTVGATSGSDGLTDRGVGTTIDAVAVSPAAGPAPFTRSGPGVRGALKPELSAEGGNYRYDRNTRQFHRDPALEVVSTSASYPTRLFATAAGTSFAAPFVTNVAGRLVTRYPGFSANAIRALMLQGAAHLDQTVQLLSELPDAEAAHHALCGYGTLEWERCGFSDDNRVVMLAEDELRPDDFHVFRIPMTPEFTEIRGPHEVSIGLAFSPPIRNRRYDYLAHQIDFQLARAIELDDVFELSSAEFDAPDGEKLSAHERTMRPTRTARNKGANQMARYPSSQRPQESFRDDWFVVVKSLNQWMRPGADPQPYALAVSLEVERATNLYAELDIRLAAELEAEAQA